MENMKKNNFIIILFQKLIIIQNYIHNKLTIIFYSVHKLFMSTGTVWHRTIDSQNEHALNEV
jgi:hypothetical protein